MIAIWLSPFYILLHIYLFWWIHRWMTAIHPLMGSFWITVPFLAIFTVFTLSPIPAAFGRSRLKIITKKLSGWWLGILTYFLFLQILVFAARACYLTLQRRSLFSSDGNRATILYGAFVVLGTVSFTIYGKWNASHIRKTTYHVAIPKASPRPSLKIALIADLHMGGTIGLHHVRKVCRAIRSMHPDLIVMAGDLFDNDFSSIAQPDKIAAEFKSLTARYGCYACWGNHDIEETILAGFTFPSETKEAVSDSPMERFLETAGIRLLKDETILIDHAFYLSGRLDASCKEKSGITRLSPFELTAGLNKNLPVIVIDHQPSQLQELSDAGADLDLSGHTHDGQIFPGNITTRIGWQNSCGMLQVGNMTSIVTSGAGTWGPALRIGTHSEAVEINLSFHK